MATSRAKKAAYKMATSVIVGSWLPANMEQTIIASNIIWGENRKRMRTRSIFTKIHTIPKELFSMHLPDGFL